MKFGVISDTHDNIVNLRKALEIFKTHNVEFVIHLGDYVSPYMVRAFKGVKLIGIFGNNDGEKFGLIKAFEGIGGEMKGDFYEFELDGIKFACYHGTIEKLRDALIESGKYDVVFYGHDHEFANKKVGNTLAINPGTAHGFEVKPTIAIFDTKSKQAEIIGL